MNPAAGQHERYRGFHVDTAPLAGGAWASQIRDPLTGRQWSRDAGFGSVGQAAAYAYAVIDDLCRREVDQVFALAFGMKQG